MHQKAVHNLKLFPPFTCLLPFSSFSPLGRGGEDGKRLLEKRGHQKLQCQNLLIGKQLMGPANP